MIKFTKKVIYYNKSKYMHEITTEKKEFYNMSEALEFFNNYKLKYYINNKSITTLEESDLIYSTSTGVKRLYKRINIDGEEEKNEIKGDF